MSTRNRLAPLMTLAAAIAVGAGLQMMKVDLIGQAMGAGDPVVQIYRATADADWVPNGFSIEAEEDGVRFPQIVTDNDVVVSTVRLDGNRVRRQRVDHLAATADTIDIFTLVGDPALLGGGVVGEAGSLGKVKIKRHDTRISLGFTRSYVDPVVFVQVSDSFGGQPITAYVDGVTADGATVVITEPAAFNGRHDNERIHYLVLEAGHYQLDDGAVLEVGTVRRQTQQRGYDRTPSVTLQSPTDGEPVVVTTIQSTSVPGFMETRVRKTSDGSDRYTGFEMRFAHEQDAPLDPVFLQGSGPAVDYTIGYLSYGTPFVEGPGKIVLRDARGDWAGYDYSRRPRGACIDLAGTAADGLSTGHVTAAPAGSRVSVVRYLEPNCVGYPDRGDATDSSAIVDITPPGEHHARSIRVLWRSEVEQRERRTWGDDEVIIQDEFNSFMVKNGDLKLFRTLPAEGMLYEAWSTAYGDIAEARFNADGSFSLHTASGTRRFATRTGQRVDRLEIEGECTLVTVKDTDALRDVVGGECPEDDVPTTALPVMPDLAVVFTDLDRDGHNELVLDLQLPDGSGHLFDNPLSIADLLTTYGFDVPAQWWDLLSPTQQTLLLAQIPASAGYGDEIDGAETQATVDAFEGRRPAATIEYRARTQGLSVEAGGAVTVEQPTSILVGGMEVRVPATTTTITAGQVHYMAEVDQYGPGYELSVTPLQVDFDVAGAATVTFVGPQAAASVNLDGGGLTVGGSFSVVGIGFAVGDEDGSYAGISADVGVGFWGDAAWGRDGQYGFAVAVPVVPVGVAVYVHHDDVMMAYDFGEGWALEGYETVQELGPAYWARARDWALAHDGDLVVRVEDTWADSRVSIERYTDPGAGVQKVKMMVGSTSQAVQSVLDDASQLGEALDVVGDTLADGAEVAGAALVDWADGVGEYALRAATDLLDGAKGIYKKVKFW